jgi:hypothetical protein
MILSPSARIAAAQAASQMFPQEFIAQLRFRHSGD